MQLNVLFALVLFSLATVLTAPLENEVELAKRAKETIMYGNQQNPPRRIKKRDPSDSDETSDEDLKGEVLAMPARDVQKPVETVDVPEAEVTISPKQENGSTESDGENDEPVVETKDFQTPSEDIDPEVQEMLTDKPVNDDTVIPAETEENEKKMSNLFKYLMKYENLFDNTPYNGFDQSRYYIFRRRRSLLKHLSQQKYDSNKAVKRGKRIKRDLYDDDDMYYYPYESPILTAEPDTYDDIEPELEESELLAYLLSLYDDRPESQEPVFEYETPYQRALEEAVEVEAQPSYYSPVKRQMLSAIPGLRKRYFYPVNREPQTHWGAFVPEQKREYLDAYERVLRLARALDNSVESNYYPELYEGYRKK